VIMGHEYVGIVDSVGAGVNGFEKGDYVISLTAGKTCGTCRYCRQGFLMLCEERLSIGSGMNGAFAEYMTISADLAIKVPDEIENKEVLAICEPLSCVVRAVIERATVKGGDAVLVTGPGAIGLLALQLAKVQGAYVIVSGTPQDEHRLELAKKMGADRIAVDTESLKNIIKEVSPIGVDVAFECSGAAPAAKICLESLRKQGLYSQVGLFGKEIQIDMDKFLYKEIQMTNGFATTRTSWETALRLLKNKQVDLAPLINSKVSLENWAEGFDIFMRKKAYKVLLIP
jgi:L-iditol 2-dehydrogenase